LIEAVQGENPESHFVLGMQWHPERTHDVDELSAGIFRDFVKAVVANKLKRTTQRS
jgi:putative glutamine amidotransferase